MFVEASGFAGLIDGLQVEVKGVQQTGFVRLTRVHRKDDDGGAAQRVGTLSSISGSGSNLILTVGGTTVTTTAATDVCRRGDAVPMAVLQVGMVLEVEGSSAGGGIAARKLTIESDAHDADFEGVVTGATDGRCPAVRFTAGGRSVETTATTEFKDVSCGGLVVGVRLNIRGVVHLDGHVVATRVERD